MIDNPGMNENNKILFFISYLKLQKTKKFIADLSPSPKTYPTIDITARERV